MRSGIGNLALRFMAMAVLFAPAAAAQPQDKTVSPSPAARPAPSSGAHAAPAAARPAPLSEAASRRSPPTGSPSPRSSTLDQTSASRSGTRDGMRESRTYGSERRASSNERPDPDRDREASSNERPDRDRDRESVHLRVYYPPPPPAPEAALEPPVTHTTGSESTVLYDAVAEGLKAQIPATEHRVPASSSLCRPPYRMTASDGCQK